MKVLSYILVALFCLFLLMGIISKGKDGLAMLGGALGVACIAYGIGLTYCLIHAFMTKRYAPAFFLLFIPFFYSFIYVVVEIEDASSKEASKILVWGGFVGVLVSGVSCAMAGASIFS